MERNFINHLYSQLEEITELNQRVDHSFAINNKDETLEEEVFKLKIERKALALMFANGKLQDRFYVDTVNVKNLFCTDEINYLKDRIEITKNLFIRIKYLIIVWNNTKNQDFAKKAFDQILNFIQDSSQDQILTFNKKNELLLICRNITEAIKYRVEYYLKELSILKSDIKNSYDFYNFLIQCSENKLLKSVKLSNLLFDFENYIEFGPQHYFSNVHGMEKLKPLLQKSKIPLNRLYFCLAKNEDDLINHRNNNDFIQLDSLRKKAEYLRLSGNLKDSKDVLKELTQIKFDVHLDKINFQTSSTEHKELEILWKIIDGTSDLISSLESKYILEYFSKHSDNLHQITTDKGDKKLFNDAFKTIVMDINRNTKEKSNDGNKLSENIGGFYSLFFIPIFEQSLYKSILNGNLNYINFYDFFENSWIGLKTKFNNGNLVIEETWLDLIKPALYNFFALFELTVIHKKSDLNPYIICIDSLTLKFEGIIRDFIRWMGGSTIKNKNGSNEEILLDEMLNHEILLESFEENEIELFKFVFTRQGLNIRNDVVHGFYKSADYDFKKVSLIFLCILRLGKYQFDIKYDNDL